MKENIFPTPEPEELVTIAKDVDADDPEASDLLDVIGRDTSEEEHNMRSQRRRQLLPPLVAVHSCWSRSTFAPSASAPY